MGVNSEVLRPRFPKGAIRVPERAGSLKVPGRSRKLRLPPAAAAHADQQEKTSVASGKRISYTANREFPFQVGEGDRAMVRLWLLLCVLLLCVGCATEDTKAQWEEALKDLRGDNMQMRGNFSGLDSPEVRPAHSNQDR